MLYKFCSTPKSTGSSDVSIEKCFIASTVAKPLFCIPTSIAIVFAPRLSTLHNFAPINTSDSFLNHLR